MHLVVMPCPVTKVKEKLYQPSPGSAADTPNPSEMTVWVIYQGEEPQPAVVLAEGKENAELVVEEDYYKCQVHHVTSSRKKDCHWHCFLLVLLLILCAYTPVGRAYGMQVIVFFF